jgi:enoyl-CoA hydratase/carnithine racemase
MNESVRVTFEDDLAYVTLTRPDKHNGIDWPMFEGLGRAAESLANTQMRGVILQGEGPSFCAGLDFKSVMANRVKLAKGFAELYRSSANVFQKACVAWRAVPAPVFAVIHGNCFGGGLQLALAADFRFATPDARLSVLESKWGLIPDMGAALTLRELVPIDVAKELTMTGRVVSGTDAKALGLVTHVTETPLEAAKALAAEIATRSPDCVALAKALFQNAWTASNDGALALERKYQRKIMGSKNQRIAMKRNMGSPDAPFAKRTKK